VLLEVILLIGELLNREVVPIEEDCNVIAIVTCESANLLETEVISVLEGTRDSLGRWFRKSEGFSSVEGCNVVDRVAWVCVFDEQGERQIHIESVIRRESYWLAIENYI
jgi:hypothetical protein